MSAAWDETRIQQYITDGVEESLTLDYKAAGALAADKKAEIIKDVSAMANSAGGIIIYGVAEYQDDQHEHLPEKITPIDRTQFSKEWLEQVISNIRPKIDVLIHPVSLNTAPNHVVYVVEIPQSSTAHQARDKRYYKRFNFLSEAMEDYEIRDVMSRGKYPNLEIDFKIVVIRRKVSNSPLQEVERTPIYRLNVSVTNAGGIYAQYFNIFVRMPKDMGIPITPIPSVFFQSDGQMYREMFLINRNPQGTYDPLLPRRKFQWDFNLHEGFGNYVDNKISWVIYADDAPNKNGEIYIRDIKHVDESALREEG